MASQSNSESPLGTLRFERKAVRGVVSYGVIVGMLVLLVAMPALLAGVGQKKVNALSFLIPIAGIGFVVWFSWIFKRRRTQRLRCHEHGLVLLQAGSNTTLRFDEIESFVIENTKITARGWADGKDRELVFRWILTAVDVEKAILLDLVGEAMSEKLGSQLVAQGVAPWTPATRIYTDKVIHRSPLGIEEEIPLDAITFTTITRNSKNESSLWIYHDIPDQPALKIPTTLENFYPGYYLLGMYLRQRSEMTGRMVQVVTAAESQTISADALTTEEKSGWKGSGAALVYIAISLVVGLGKCDRKKKRQPRQQPVPVHQPFNQERIREFQRKHQLPPPPLPIRELPRPGRPAED